MTFTMKGSLINSSDENLFLRCLGIILPVRGEDK